jgi:phytoene dehydrogenase-like protein
VRPSPDGDETLPGMPGQFDAVVVGSGPNGLVAAVTLARAGWRVIVLEASDTAGGGLRSWALTGAGYVNDVCSAVHPLGVGSPALRALPLEDHGLRWIQPDAALAHPLDGGRVALLERSVDATARGLDADADAYRSLLAPLVDDGYELIDSMMSPLRVPKAPIATARFGLKALRSATSLATRFADDKARALLAGAAAHAVLPLDAAGTAGYGLFMTMLGHVVGWPIAEGGSQRIADALLALLVAHGGEVVTGVEVTSLAQLPPARAVLLDLTPRQVRRIAGDAAPARYARALDRYRYGPGVFKVDWALDGPIPWRAPEAARAATVHVGGAITDIVASEAAVAAGRHDDRPFVILVQPSLFDSTRAPAGAHTAWAYCHVPNGSTVDRTVAIEAQVERFAPGFRDRVVETHTMNTDAFERHDANYVGGDISGGVGDLRQLFTRPVVSVHPWVTPIPHVYLCSSSTPPGGGVHGMCGWHAARAVLARERR